MKRKKREMNLSLLLISSLSHSQLTSAINLSQHGNQSSLRLIFILTSALACVSMLQPHLVNPTTQITSGHVGGSHFDDELLISRKPVTPQVRISSSSNESNLTQPMAISQPHEPPLLITIKRQDQLEQPSEREDAAYREDQRLDGDLLAVESGRSPAVVGAQLAAAHQHQRHQHAFVAPYETTASQAEVSKVAAANFSSTIKQQQLSFNSSTVKSGNDQSSSETSDILQQPPAQTQLLRLAPHAPLEPIYLKHNLPQLAQVTADSSDHNQQQAPQVPPLKRSQIVAFSHPSHTSAGSFALLPSWPNIYIAQRERTVPPPPPPSPSTATPPSSRDPKVPLAMPDWSRMRQKGENSHPLETQTSKNSRPPAAAFFSDSFHNPFASTATSDKLTNSKQQQQLTAAKRPPSSNLTTASEVEYEREDDERRTNEEENTQDLTAGSQQRLNDDDPARQKTPTASADSAQWAKVLQEAAKSQQQQQLATKSLMFTNKSIVSLTCDTHDMLLGLKFKAPFYGSVETNLDPLRQCRIFGNGSHYYEMRISLLECGTRQEMPRLYINNIQITYRSNNSKRAQISSNNAENSDSSSSYLRQSHELRTSSHRAELRAELQSTPALEMSGADRERLTREADEVKTLICSYPQQLRTRPSHGTLDMPPGELNSPHDSINDLRPTRPYSIAFNGRGGASQSRPDAKEDTTTPRNDLSGASVGSPAPPRRNPSDRIIDATNIDDPAGAARLFYYEPILLIAGLLLLAVAVTLALVSSAYLARRHARRSNSASSPSARSRPAVSLMGVAGNGDDDDDAEDIKNSARIYRISPAQLANRSGGSPLVAGHLAPPLIGMSKEELLTKRPSAKRYSTLAQKDKKRPSQAEKSKALATAAKRSRTPGSFSGSEASAQTSAGDTTSDSLESATKRGQSESASTIDIPPMVGGKQQQLQQRRRKGTSESALRELSSQRNKTTAPQATITSNRRTHTTSPVSPKEDEELPPAITREEYKREISFEKIVEKTTSSQSHHRKPPSTTPTNDPSSKPPEPAKRTQPSESPLPFGSLRSKLTSPIEYRRLQNISQLFGDPLTPEQQDELHLRYRNKIARTMSDRERLDLRKLFQHDEVFRSNVVDSIDLDTFTRKLRDNPKYAGKFTPATWALLQDIMLNLSMSEPVVSRTSQRVATTTKLDELFSTQPSQGQRGERPSDSKTRSLAAGDEGSNKKVALTTQDKPTAGPSGNKPKVTNLDETKFWRPAAKPSEVYHGQPQGAPQKVHTKPPPNQRVDLPPPPVAVSSSETIRSQNLASHTTTNKMVRRSGDDADSTPPPPATAIRVSQTNTARTRRDGSTMINIDSITNISTPRSFTSFTRSSFEQTTKYQEEDSLPYMDEFSQNSIDSSTDQRSFSSSSLDNNNKTTPHGRHKSRR